MVINCLSGHNPRLPVYYDLEDNSIIADGRQAGLASRAQVFCNQHFPLQDLNLVSMQT